MRAIAGLTQSDCYDIHCKPCRLNLVDYLSGRFPAGRDLPDPDLIIGAGHDTHLPMLCAGRARSGKTVVLMKPGLPVSWFDYCLIPAHDGPRKRARTIVTQGALNTVTPSLQQDTCRGMILVGGGSRYFRWSNAALLRQITAVLNGSTLQWQITDSTRTPAVTRRSLQAFTADTIHFVPFQSCAPEWLPGQLQQTATVWVTEDSISMIYEALTAGAAVGIFRMPLKKRGRLSRAIEDLVGKQMITPFENWKTGADLAAPTPPLNEAERCAKLLLGRLALSGDLSDNG